MKTEEYSVDTQEDHVGLNNKRDNSKVYFFIIAIAALLATNVYFYVKFKSSGEKLYTVTLQKENLQSQIDIIESELDNIKSQGITSNASLVSGEQAARVKIENLRSSLEKGEISDKEIEIARQDVFKLKDEVFKMKDEVIGLRIRNEMLAEANSELAKKIEESENRAIELDNDRQALSSKISQASSIKVSNIHIVGVETKKDGSFENETRAKRIDNLQINFTLADNPLANTGTKQIYGRIINPKGNLIANSADIFYVHGEKLQYTFKDNINFSNNGQEYQIIWTDADHKFLKGAYTILLYADNTIMGRSSLVLK